MLVRGVSVVLAFFCDILRIMFRFSTFFQFEVVRLCLHPLVSLYEYCNNNIVDFGFVVFTKYLCGKIILVSEWINISTPTSRFGWTGSFCVLWCGATQSTVLVWAAFMLSWNDLRRLVKMLNSLASFSSFIWWMIWTGVEPVMLNLQSATNQRTHRVAPPAGEWMDTLLYRRSLFLRRVCIFEVSLE